MTSILAQRLLAARRMRGVSGVEIAGRAGVVPGNLSNMEAGRSAPSVDALLRLADALDVDVDWLLGRTDEPTSRSETACSLASRISQLSEADRRLLDLTIDTLEIRRRGGDPNVALRLRRRVEAARKQQQTDSNDINQEAQPSSDAGARSEECT